MLILCTGKFTKRINEYMAQEKEYTGSFTLEGILELTGINLSRQEVVPIQEEHRKMNIQ